MPHLPPFAAAAAASCLRQLQMNSLSWECSPFSNLVQLAPSIIQKYKNRRNSQNCTVISSCHYCKCNMTSRSSSCAKIGSFARTRTLSAPMISRKT